MQNILEKSQKDPIKEEEEKQQNGRHKIMAKISNFANSREKEKNKEKNKEKKEKKGEKRKDKEEKKC